MLKMKVSVDKIYMIWSQGKLSSPVGETAAANKTRRRKRRKQAAKWTHAKAYCCIDFFPSARTHTHTHTHTMGHQKWRNNNTVSSAPAFFFCYNTTPKSSPVVRGQKKMEFVFDQKYLTSNNSSDPCVFRSDGQTREKELKRNNRFIIAHIIHYFLEFIFFLVAMIGSWHDKKTNKSNYFVTL